MNDDQKDLRDEVKAVRDALSKGREELARLAEGHATADELAGAVEELVESGALPPEECRRLRTPWRQLHASLNGYWANAPTPQPMFVALSGVTSTTSTSPLMSSDFLVQFAVGSPQRERAVAAQERVTHVVERPQQVEQLAREMARCGLDAARSGHLSAVDHLREAKNALDAAAGRSAVAVLISIRSAMDTAVADLMQRRPRQEETGRGSRQKVTSVLRQTAQAGFGDEYLEIVAGDFETARLALPDSKQAAMQPHEIAGLFYRTVVVLLATLRAIDESKLRPR